MLATFVGLAFVWVLLLGSQALVDGTCDTASCHNKPLWQCSLSTCTGLGSQLCVVVLSVSALACGTTTALVTCVLSCCWRASPPDRCVAAQSVSAHARARDLARAQGPVLQTAVGLAAELARVADWACVPVRGGPVRQCVGLRHHHRTRDACVVLLLACVTARSLRGCPVSLGSRACPRSCARAGAWSPTSCPARCRARSGHCMRL
jgi:hypothetical protein